MSHVECDVIEKEGLRRKRHHSQSQFSFLKRNDFSLFLWLDLCNGHDTRQQSEADVVTKLNEGTTATNDMTERKKETEIDLKFVQTS